MNTTQPSIGWHPDVVLISALAAPLALALLSVLPPLRRHTPWMTAAAALPAFFCALTAPLGGTVEFSWLVLESRFGMDATGKSFLLFTALLWLLAAVFAVGYMAGDKKSYRFFFGFLLAMGGNIGLILAQDMLSYLVTFALMSFASYSLVVHTQDAKAVHSGRVYIALVIIGEIFLFSAMILHAGNGGDLNFSGLRSVPSTPLVAALFFLGFGIKAGAVLLHVWLPLAHTVAPTPASAVLSGSMIKAGLLGWIRFLPPGAGGEALWGGVFLAAGIVAAFYGVAMGLGQSHPKTILAYSSISQMGLITVAFGIGLFAGDGTSAAVGAVLLYAFHHALAKGALFLGVGVVGGLEGRRRARRWATAVLAIAALALAGAPLTSGAVAKTALKMVMGNLPAGWQQALAVLLPLAAAGTTVLMGRFFYALRAFGTHQHHASRTEIFSWVALMGFSTAVLFLMPAGHPAVQTMLKPAGIWLSLWPVLVGTALTAVVWFWSRRTGRRIPWRPPAGDLLVPVERLAGAGKRWAATLMGNGGWAFRRPSEDETRPRVLEKPQRIEIWEAGLRRWNTAGLIFAGAVCALLFVLSRP